MKKNFIYLLFYLFSSIALYSTQKGVIIVPVANLIGQPYSQIFQSSITTPHYNSMPIAHKYGKYACLRIHQLLFNDVVEILDDHHDEVKIKLPNLYFELANRPDKYSTLWTNKKNILPFYELRKHNIDISKIPEPISYTKKTIPTQNIITLAIPFYNSKLGNMFSAGTRFVRAPGDTQKEFAVWILNPKIKKIEKYYIPKKISIINPPTDKNSQRQCFVKLLKKWAHVKKGFIPYVWGGSSFTGVCTDAKFHIIKKNDPQSNTIEVYKWPTYKKSPHGGFDCSALILKAAQMCAIPYYYRNTTTLEKHLTPITTVKKIKEGDLIWYPGHVMIVGDLKKNTLIESRGYQSGHGKVHEIALSNLFENIATYAELIDAYNKKKPLKILSTEKKVYKVVPRFKVLSLESVWNDEQNS